MDNHHDDKLPWWVFGPLARFIIPIIPVTDYRIYNECAYHDNCGTTTVIGSDEPSLSHEILQRASNDSYADDPENTHLKLVAANFFRSFCMTAGRNLDPGTPFTAWIVDVDERFKPNRELQIRGLIAQVTPRNTRYTNHKNNRYKLYTLFCLAKELEIMTIHPVKPGQELDTVKESKGWDEDLKVDRNFKKIYNAVVDHYEKSKRENENDPAKVMQTVYVCPCLQINSGVGAGEIQRCDLREVDTKPWLQLDQKYDLPESEASENQAGTASQ